MDAAQRIRGAMARVHELRTSATNAPGLEAALWEVKHLQSRRFAGTYADLLAASETAPAAQFFLTELYGAGNFAERDAQFARIAGTVEKLFPQHVGALAASLAELHALTEDLDHGMARAWIHEQNQLAGDGPARYVSAWRDVGRREDRLGQLHTVMVIGQDLVRMTRLPGLRLMLKMMRGPAAAAGLRALQDFLESGFDTFAGLARRGRAEAFLGAIETRETQWVGQLFDADRVTCVTELGRILGEAR